MGSLWIIRLTDYLMFIWLFTALTLGYGARQEWKNAAMQSVLYALAGSGLILLQERFYPSYLVYHLIFIATGILYSITALRGQAGPKITTVALYCASYILAYDFLIPLFALSQFVQGRMILQGVHVLLAFFLGKYPLNSKRKIPATYWMPVLIVCTLLMIWALLPHSVMGDHTTLHIITSFTMLIILYVVYYLCSKMLRDYEKRLVHIGMQEMDNREAALREENQRLHDTLRRGRHELQNHVSTLSALLEQGNIQDALQLLEHIELPAAVHAVASGNAIVDAILERYAALARKQDIAFSAEACLDGPIPVADADLSSLLNNLLSNALEASGYIAQPEVEIRIYPAKDYLCILTRNKADATRLKANPQLHTTKQDTDMHGIGLQIVREIAQKYNGWVDITIQDARFTVQVMLLVEGN